jgi:hypothetical protein
MMHVVVNIVVGVIRMNVCKKMMMSPCLMLVVTFMAAVCMKQFVVMHEEVTSSVGPNDQIASGTCYLSVLTPLFHMHIICNMQASLGGGWQASSKATISCRACQWDSSGSLSFAHAAPCM